MKSAAGSLVLLFMVSLDPLCAQETIEGALRTTILAVGGERGWGVGIHGHAVGWVLDRPRHHVTVSARLGNGGGHAYADVYLMTAIGPGATDADEVGRTSFDLPFPFDDWVPLFVDVDLEPGAYWLVVAKPREHVFSSINWIVAEPLHLTSACDVHYLGTQSYTFLSDVAEYIPASKFKKRYEPYGFQIEITDAALTGEGEGEGCGNDMR